jgi:hypothetical protein
VWVLADPRVNLLRFHWASISHAVITEAPSSGPAHARRRSAAFPCIGSQHAKGLAADSDGEPTGPVSPYGGYPSRAQCPVRIMPQPSSRTRSSQTGQGERDSPPRARVTIWSYLANLNPERTINRDPRSCCPDRVRQPILGNCACSAASELRNSFAKPSCRRARQISRLSESSSSPAAPASVVPTSAAAS